MKKSSDSSLPNDVGALKARLAEAERMLEKTREELSRTRTSENVLREAFTDMPFGLGVFDADDCLLFYNEAYVDTFPVLVAKGVIKPGIYFEDIVRAGAEEGLVKVGPGGIEEYVKERMRIRKRPTQDEPRRYIRTTGQWVESIERRTKTGGYVSMRTNVTELREVQEQQLKAEAANQAKSSFLANMSHEIRTPMNGVIGMIELLQQTEMTTDQANMMRTVRDSAFGLLGIINDILDFSKIEAGKLTLEQIDVCVRDVIEGVAQTLLPNAIEKNVELKMYIDPDIPRWLVSDPVRLRQILFNIIGNAIKFSGSDEVAIGEVTIQANVMEREGSKATVRFTVNDTGVGIDEDVLSGLFEPFTQADTSTTRQFGGTGLGLTISKSLVDRMGGDIEVESQVGYGSSFTITLPFEIAERDQSPWEDIDLSGVRVLVDSQVPFLNSALHAYLKHVNADVEFTNDVDDVRHRAREAAEQKRPYGIVFINSEDDRYRNALIKSMRADPLTASQQYVLFEKDRRKKKGRVSEDVVVVEFKPLLPSTFLASLGTVIGNRNPKTAAPSTGGGAVEVPTVDVAERLGQLILVAEDNMINQMVIVRQLKVLGYAAEVAADGIEALRMMEKRKYGLLLTDCHMPNLDGYGLSQAVREREQGTDRRIPIIAITADALTGEAERCLVAGMDEYLSKPVELTKLRETIAAWLRPAQPDMDCPAETVGVNALAKAAHS